MRRIDCHNAIRQVRSSYETALRTVNVLIEIVKNQPEYLYQDELSLAELRALPGELQAVYFVRMFASFESSLRSFWRTTVRDTKPATHQLITSIAGRLAVPQDTLDAVHEIRNFRNYLIHEEHQDKRRFGIEEASGHLNTYLARLPLEW